METCSTSSPLCFYCFYFIIIYEYPLNKRFYPQVRSAIQALQEMTGPVWHAAHSNPNLQWNAPPNQLARSCSHPPDVFCWDQVIYYENQVDRSSCFTLNELHRSVQIFTNMKQNIINTYIFR